MSALNNYNKEQQQIEEQPGTKWQWRQTTFYKP